MYRKNVAGQSIFFVLVNAATGAAITGASVTVYRALDTAAQTAATGTVNEMGNGQYRFDLSQADTNADNGSFLFLANNAVPVEKTVVFTAANPTDATAFGLSRITGIQSKTDLIPADIGSVIIAANVNHRTVQITGSQHVASVVHDAEPNSIPEDAFAANALSARVLATDAVNEIAGAVTGGGGDASQATLLAVKAKTDLISATNVTYSGPVDPTGKIAAPIIRGDDYLAANGRAFNWTITAITGLTAATCTSRLGFKSGTTTLIVNGTVTDNGNGTWTASHDVTRTQSATLTQQQYDWSVEIVHSGGTEITPVRSGRGVAVAEKFS